MPRKKKKDTLILEVPKNATLRQIYAKYKAEFTAADLQKYTEPWKGVPLKDVLPELEAIQLQESSKRRKNTNGGAARSWWNCS